MLVKMLQTVNEPPHTYPAGTQHDVSADTALRWFIDRKALLIKPEKPADTREKAISTADHRETR